MRSQRYGNEPKARKKTCKNEYAFSHDGTSRKFEFMKPVKSSRTKKEEYDEMIPDVHHGEEF